MEVRLGGSLHYNVVHTLQDLLFSSTYLVRAFVPFNENVFLKLTKLLNKNNYRDGWNWIRAHSPAQETWRVSNL